MSAMLQAMHSLGSAKIFADAAYVRRCSKRVLLDYFSYFLDKNRYLLRLTMLYPPDCKRVT